MIPAVIAGATRHLDAPHGWDEAKEGHCGKLPIQDVVDDRDGFATRRMISAWEMLPAEVAAMSAGGKVLLSIVGTAHPPVWLDVSLPFPTWKPPLQEGLGVLVTLLEGIYSPKEIVTWLGSSHPMLQGDIPLRMIMKGDLPKVIAYVRALVGALDVQG